VGLSLQEFLALLLATRTRSENCCEIGLIFLFSYENRMSDHLQTSGQGSGSYSSIIFSRRLGVNLIELLHLYYTSVAIVLES